MKRIHFPLLVLFATSIQLALGSEAPALIDRPNADSGAPTQISVGIWVVDINSIDSAQQTFTAEIAVVLRWKDPRLAHTGNGVVRYPREQIWQPRVGIVNETNSVSRKMPDSVEVEPDGTVTYRQLYVGAFTQPLRLQSFPFDRQNFRVQLVAVRYQSHEVMFLPDHVWIRDGLKEAGGISPSRCSRVKNWEIIADNVKKAGWSLGWVSAVDSHGRTIFVADAASTESGENNLRVLSGYKQSFGNIWPILSLFLTTMF